MSTYPPGVPVHRHADISADGRYRYSLTRTWGPDPWTERRATFIMLNPSTADADVDDPTIRRCVGFARALGYDRLDVVNLYAYRATKPADLWRADDPVGPSADVYLADAARRARTTGSPFIAAWGTNAKPDRVAQALHVIANHGATSLLSSLGTTKAGHPRHPLYVPGDARPELWAPA